MDDYISILKSLNDDDDYTLPLKEGINLQDLNLTDDKGGIQFEVDSTYHHVEEPKQDIPAYVPEDSTLTALGFDIDSIDEASEGDDVESPFSKLSKSMENLTEDGGVKKKVISPGIGGVVPSNVQVTIHYSAYLEYSDEPFDSTRLRGRPFRYVLGCGEMIPGLECGIATMKKNEESMFLVTPNYAFGMTGVPPRIPGNATILFRVELIEWTEAVEVHKYFQLSWEERKVCEFSLLKKVAEHFLQEGKSKYQQRRYIPASRMFIQGIKAIEEFQPANEEIETEFHRLLIRLCQNACVVSMKLNNFGAVKYYADKALEIDPKSVKALFQKGKAQRHCGDFDLAVKTLCKAQALEPKNRVIAAELEELNKYKAAMEFSYSDMCQKMFGGSRKSKGYNSTTNACSTESSLSDQFTESINSKLDTFLQSDIMELPLPRSKFTEAELDIIKKICKDKNLEYMEKGQGSNRHIRLCKKEPASPLT